ncbi:hypothetical protein BJH93_03980 [Kocuria polaris]|nr:hypothetical protein [Kocuria polaris]
MPGHWYLFQYTADLRKHEAKNIGVALHDGSRWHFRFRGYDRGRVSGSQIRGLGVPKDVYTSWIDYFQRKAWEEDWTTALTLQSRRPSNFSVIKGGIILEQTAEWPFEATRLFKDLVDVPERSTSLTQRAISIFDRAGINPQRSISIHGRWPGSDEQVDIPFSFGVGSTSLAPVEPLGLHYGALAAFRAKVDAVIQVSRPRSIVALLPLGEQDDAQIDALLRSVERDAQVIDMDRDSAPEDLQEALGA